MIERSRLPDLTTALDREATVALIAARQVGKTTLALEVGDARPSVYLDLEATEDRDKLSDPAQFLRLHEDRLIILDEIQPSQPRVGREFTAGAGAIWEMSAVSRVQPMLHSRSRSAICRSRDYLSFGHSPSTNPR
ncbi:MAG: AAA family ATPase [Pseudomonadota bacterium]